MMPMTMTTATTMLRYRGRLAGFAGATRASLSNELDALPANDPDRRFVLAMAAYAGAIARGEAPGPYTDADAERYARAFLITGSLDGDDAELAARYGVPLEQISAARLEADR